MSKEPINVGAEFDRFDICLAHYCLENDWNEGGWLRERPSNQRRLEATHVQLRRIRYKPSPVGPSGFSSLVDNWPFPKSHSSGEYDNTIQIYITNMIRFGLASKCDPHGDIAEYVWATYVPEFIAEHFPQIKEAPRAYA